MRFDTKLIHSGQSADAATGAVNVPIYLSSTFQQAAPNQNKGYVYSRTGNPTRAMLERTLAELESGHTGIAFASGMAAFATLLAHFRGASRVIATDDLYGGTWRLLEHHRKQYGLQVEYVDTTRPELVEAALEVGPTSLVFLESPTNPLMHVVDLRAVARLAHRYRAIVGVDNTFASPALQRPLELGADLVLHSTTKYLGGHSDVVGGALVTRERKLGQRLLWLQNAAGAVPSPFDCFLVLRGIHTLGVRMRAHELSAVAVARALEGSPGVRAVYYPGLKSHPQHALASRQMDGYGGMVSFDLRGGMTAARRFLRRLRVFTLAESLGGVESLVDHPATMTHASVAKEVREARGITDGLIRLSCGIEDPRDLAADVLQALRAV
ncbi:MAG: PLP-dependent aspartate aminotransferase family protein [Thermoplasmata archaeon]